MKEFKIKKRMNHYDKEGFWVYINYCCLGNFRLKEIKSFTNLTNLIILETRNDLETRSEAPAFHVLQKMIQDSIKT